MRSTVGSDSIQPNGSSLENAAGFRFGDFEYDPARRELRKHGIRVRVGRQPMAVLLTLVETPGRLVTREELRQRLWGSGTYVDFERGLNSAIKRLRDALCETADEPTYIETVVGSGYRWIAPVELLPAENEATKPGDSPLAAISGKSVLAPRAGLREWMRSSPAAWSLGTVLGCAFILSLVAANWRPRPHVAFTTNDWVLVAAFENRTGNAELDGGVLQTALERELNNSQFVHVVPRERVHDVLSLMRRPVEASLTPDVAREVCLRDGGIKLLLEGRVEKLDGDYVLSVNVVDPASGATVHAASSDARSQAEILGAMHHLGDNLRSNLGEELPQIQLSDLQYEKVTTPSLQALRLFNSGFELLINEDRQRAAEYFQQATDTDPNFATAWVYLGWARFGSLQPDATQDSGDFAFRRAFELADQVSERERLFILESWYMVQGDAAEALRSGERLAHLYPDHYWGASNAILLLGGAHREAEAIAMEKQCLRIRPLASRARQLAQDLEQSNPSAAERFRQLAEQLAARDPQELFAMQMVRAAGAWRRGNVALALSPAQSAQPATASQTEQKALALTALGQLRAAEALAPSVPHPQHVALMLAFLRGGRSGMSEYVRDHSFSGAQFRSDSLLMYAATVPLNQRARMLDNLTFAMVPALRSATREAIEGEWMLDGAGSASATHRLETALRDGIKGPVTFNPTAQMYLADSLAIAYERAGRQEQAIATLEQYSQLDGDLSWFVLVPLTQRHLADLYRQTGEIGKAKAIETKLTALLSHADPDYSLDAQRGRRGPTGAGLTVDARVH